MSGNPSLSMFFLKEKSAEMWFDIKWHTSELNGTGQLGSQKHFLMVTEWAQLKRGNSPVI